LVISSAKRLSTRFRSCVVEIALSEAAALPCEDGCQGRLQLCVIQQESASRAYGKRATKVPGTCRRFGWKPGCFQTGCPMFSGRYSYA